MTVDENKLGPLNDHNLLHILEASCRKASNKDIDALSGDLAELRKDVELGPVLNETMQGGNQRLVRYEHIKSKINSAKQRHEIR